MSKSNGHDHDYGQKKDNVTPFQRPAPQPEAPSLQDSHSADAPLINLPPFTKWLCLALLVFGGVQQFLPDAMLETLFLQTAFVPLRITSGDLSALPTFVTHMFLHGGWLHLLMNVFMLAAFGAGLEKNLGAQQAAIIFFLSGVLGAVAHYLCAMDSPQPLIGASGGVSGLFGALCYWMADRNMLQGNKSGASGLMPLVIVWVLTSVFFGYFGMPGAGGSIAWVVHVAGFLVGLTYYHLLVVRRRKGH